METKRQQFEKRFISSDMTPDQIAGAWSVFEWLEKQLEVRAISDQEIEDRAKEKYPLENYNPSFGGSVDELKTISEYNINQKLQSMAYADGYKQALRDMNDRANGKEAGYNKLDLARAHFAGATFAYGRKSATKEEREKSFEAWYSVMQNWPRPNE